MTETNDYSDERPSLDPELTEELTEPVPRDASHCGPPPMPRLPAERVEPITNRHLKVTVAALRAKQLYRGALPRLKRFWPDPNTGERTVPDVTIEAVAIEEVEENLIVYRLPEHLRSVQKDETAAQATGRRQTPSDARRRQ